MSGSLTRDRLLQTDHRYLLAVGSAVLGYAYYVLFLSYQALGGVQFYTVIATVAVSSVALPAIVMLWNADRVSAYLLGLVPSAGMGIGMAFNLTGGRGDYLVDAARVVLVLWGFAIPLVTLGFVLGAGWRYRDTLRDRARYLLVTVGVAGVVTLVLALLWKFTGVLSVDTLS